MGVEQGLETFVQELLSKWKHASRGIENEMIVITDLISKNKLAKDIASLNQLLEPQGLQIIESEPGFMEASLMSEKNQRNNLSCGYSLTKIG